MSKNKLKKFADNDKFEHLFQPRPHDMLVNDFFLKGKWNSDYFKNENPIVLEIGCGKGEYTTGLAQLFSDKNYIGIDYKGPRLWRGCKTVEEKKLSNVAFIRNKVEFLSSFFDNNEISDIWITFPDPQPKRDKKKLTSERFLNIFKGILSPGGYVRLKTDSKHMFDFTQRIIDLNDILLDFASDDIYGENESHRTHNIKTFYEEQFLEENKKITYTKFQIEKEKEYINPPRIPRIKQKRKRYK